MVSKLINVLLKPFNNVFCVCFVNIELATGSFDPVAQHMQAWKIYQHELKVQRAKPWEICHVNPGKKQICNKEHQSPTRSFSR